MLLTIPNTFANGTGEANKIDAVQMNANFSAVVTVLNGNIEKNNVKTGSAICLNDTAMTISGAWTFNAFPTVPNASVPDAKLSANVPLKNAANVFSAQQKFSAGIDGDKQEAVNFVVELVASNPEWGATDKGRIIFNTTDGKAYIGGNSAWKQIDYVGDYTGGAVRSYSDIGIADDGDSYKKYFKTEGASPTVKIVLKGEAFPKRFYTELGEHNHSFTGDPHTHNVTDPQHYHTTTIGSHSHGSTEYALGTHTHTISGTTGAPSATHTHVITGIQHNHQYWKSSDDSYVYTSSDNGCDSPTGTNSVGHSHTMSFTSGNPSASQAIESTNLGNKNSDSKSTGISIQNATQSGTIGNKGVSGGTLSTQQKLYAKSLTVKIDGTDVTSDILTATGWAVIGDGLETHAFHTTGTGELDASTWKAYAPGLHILEILEPESLYGTRIMIHLETT